MISYAILDNPPASEKPKRTPDADAAFGIQLHGVLYEIAIVRQYPARLALHSTLNSIS